jgi:membrane-associated phospholipid phosphatase
LRWLWAGLAIVIILSTLFTGQHNLLDPIGGIVWAWTSYRFGLWWATRQLRG